MDIPEKYALVTGASSGIGRFMCFILASRNYNILAISDQSGKLEQLKTEVESLHPVKVDPVLADLSQEKAVDGIIKYCQQQEYRVEVLVNNAGFLVYGETGNTSVDRVRSLIQLHVATPTLFCRHFSSQMVERGSGYILNVSSISAVMPYPTISLYGPTKTYLRYFSRALRYELKPSGIHVSCLLPGAIDTGFYEDTGFNIGKGRILGIVRSPEFVAKSAMKALFRDRAECIPGLLNKLVVLSFPLIPRSLIGLIYRRRLMMQAGFKSK